MGYKWWPQHSYTFAPFSFTKLCFCQVQQEGHGSHMRVLMSGVVGVCAVTAAACAGV